MEFYLTSNSSRLTSQILFYVFKFSSINVPFPDDFFDVVMSKWAFQTSEDIDSIYKEIVRVLKPGGYFIYLTSHPIRQFIEKKCKGKNYFKKEIVTSVFFDGQVVVKEPSHTLNEYLSRIFFENFILEVYEEGYDSGAEKVDGDIYPSYFIIKALRKKLLNEYMKEYIKLHKL